MAAAPLPPLSVPLPCPTPAHREESLPASPPREVPPIGGAPVSPGGHDSDDDDEPPVLHPPAPEPRPTHHQPHHHIVWSHYCHHDQAAAGRGAAFTLLMTHDSAPPARDLSTALIRANTFQALASCGLHPAHDTSIHAGRDLTPSMYGKGYGYSPPAAVFDDLHWVPQGGGTASLSPQPAPLPQHPRCQVFGYSPSRVTADDDDATPTPSLSHPPPTPALTKPPPVTTTTTTTSDVTPHPTPPQTTGKVTGKACEVSQNELVKLSGLFKYHWNCSSEEEEEEVRECAKTLYSGAKEWREMRRNLKENRSRMTSDSRSP
ncbi:synaptic defective enhancer 1-like isoform X4 [Scylla paramamosain]|uniref:synaptic defective enhancer 1-like isoform X4 n=1 Tax=Scylla paramamosain TaxID=85552 RepID=UPI00308388AB